MAETEIRYVVPDPANRQKDYEAIFASIGAYQKEMNPDFPDVTYTRHTAEIEQVGDSVQIKFRQRLVGMATDRTTYTAARQVVINKIRADIEQHFPKDDHARLSRYFAGSVFRQMDAKYQKPLD